jgi:hypothetical protein
MKHARQEALDRLEPLLEQIRVLPGLREKSRGVFYRKSRPLLHFHEDPAGFFADLRLDQSWIRLPVNSPDQEAELLARLTAPLT